MAIKLIGNYAKKLGLPGYSSHSFSASIEVELSSADDIPAEVHRLYQTLQQNVDTQIQAPGFIPPGDYGMEPAKTTPQQPQQSAPPKRQSQGPRKQYGGRTTNKQAWSCSDKQRSLIDKLIKESDLTKQAVEAIAQDRFGKGVVALNKLEASGLIDMLINQPDIFEFQGGLQS